MLLFFAADHPKCARWVWVWKIWCGRILHVLKISEAVLCISFDMLWNVDQFFSRKVTAAKTHLFTTDGHRPREGCSTLRGTLSAWRDLSAIEGQLTHQRFSVLISSKKIYLSWQEFRFAQPKEFSSGAAFACGGWNLPSKNFPWQHSLSLVLQNSIHLFRKWLDQQSPFQYDTNIVINAAGLDALRNADFKR